MGTERQQQAARFFTQYDGLEIIEQLKESYWEAMLNADIGKITKLQRLESIDQTLIKISALEELEGIINQLALASDNDG